MEKSEVQSEGGLKFQSKTVDARQLERARTELKILASNQIL